MPDKEETRKKISFYGTVFGILFMIITACVSVVASAWGFVTENNRAFANEARVNMLQDERITRLEENDQKSEIRTESRFDKIEQKMDENSKESRDQWEKLWIVLSEK